MESKKITYINSFLEYEKVRSSQEIVDKLINNLRSTVEKVIKESNIEKYIIGYHFRHVFDTQSPKVTIVTKSKDLDIKYEKIYDRNKEIGLHTINHVIDSLFYPKNLSESAENEKKDNIIILKMSFSASEIKENFRLVENEGISKFRSELYEKFKQINTIYEEYEGDETLKELYKHNEEDHNVPNKISKLYGKCIYGIHNLCEKLNIEGSISYYKSIAASLYQMMSYFEAYGDEVVTFIIRPSNHFQYVLGLSFFSNQNLSYENIIEIILKLKVQFDVINKEYTQIKKDKDGILNADILEFDAIYGKNFYRTVQDGKVFPKLEYENVDLTSERSLSTEIVDIGRSDHIDNLKTSLSSFLRLAINFLHQKNEGRKVRFGLLLGNPFLIKYWLGSRPFPCSHKSGVNPDIKQANFFELENLPNQIHLLENPEERLIVIPYIDAKIANNMPMPSFLLEMGDFIEVFNNIKEGIVWLPEQRPYIYLTSRYPWAYGVVAGPDAELRLFEKGSLSAYRDGKGWKCVDYAAISKIEQLNREKDSNIIFRTLLDIAFQMSPFVRNGAKGGYLIYSPLKDNSFWDELSEVLYDLEPRRWDNQNWLTGRSILNSNYDVNNRKDFDVIPLVIQAGALDGAIILSGEKGTIKYIGRRFGLENKNTNKEGEQSTENEGKTNYHKFGSKRRAASNLIQTIRSDDKYKTLLGTYAITISSDGPITVFHSQSEENEYVDIFKNIEK